jgi:hypothetical protein
MFVSVRKKAEGLKWMEDRREEVGRGGLGRDEFGKKVWGEELGERSCGKRREERGERGERGERERGERRERRERERREEREEREKDDRGDRRKGGEREGGERGGEKVWRRRDDLAIWSCVLALLKYEWWCDANLETYILFCSEQSFVVSRGDFLLN